MEDKDFLSSKTIFSLSGSSAACLMLAKLFEMAKVPVNKVIPVMIFALIISAVALFSDKKKRKTAKVYLITFINAMLITTTTIGIHTINVSGDSGSDSKTDEVKKTTLIPFLGNEIWLPPAKLVNEIVVKEDSLRDVKTDIEIISIRDSNKNEIIAELKDTKKPDVVMNNRLKDAKDLEKQAYSDFYKGDFKSSMIKFKQVDEKYPTYRHAFEIYTFLKKNENNFEIKKDEIMKTVKTKWPEPSKIDDIKKTNPGESRNKDTTKVISSVPNVYLQKVEKSESLKTLQSSVGYKVKINYDKPNNLNVQFTGPIKTKKISSTEYEVTLSLLSSEKAFNAWSKGKEKPYKIGFNIKVKDINNSNISITKTGEFNFNKWKDEVKDIPKDTLLNRDKSKDY